MQRYLIVLFAVLFPPVICTVLALYWIVSSIEANLPLRTLAQRQHSNQDVVVLPFDLKYWAALKLPRIEQEQPEIVLIGPSRASQLRGKMFSPYRFYNASLTAWSLNQYEAMMTHVIGVSRPRIIIFSLDYFLFTDTYTSVVEPARTMYFDNNFRYQYDGAFHVPKVLWENPSLVKEKILPRLFGKGRPPDDATKLLGIDAMRTEAGFRWDGSFQYERGTLAAAEQNVASNIGIFGATPGGAGIDDQEMAALERIAALARQQQVTIVGIQFPMWHETVDILDNDPEYRPESGVWREFESRAMKTKLRELGIPFFDLSHDPLTFDSQNFVDAAHPSEIGMLRSMLSLLRNREFAEIFQKIDAAKLQADLAEAEKKHEVFDIYHNNF